MIDSLKFFGKSLLVGSEKRRSMYIARVLYICNIDRAFYYIYIYIYIYTYTHTHTYIYIYINTIKLFIYILITR